MSSSAFFHFSSWFSFDAMPFVVEGASVVSKWGWSLLLRFFARSKPSSEKVAVVTLQSSSSDSTSMLPMLFASLELSSECSSLSETPSHSQTLGFGFNRFPRLAHNKMGSVFCESGHRKQKRHPVMPRTPLWQVLL